MVKSGHYTNLTRFLYAPRPAHIMRYVSGRVVRRLTLSLLLLFFPYMSLNGLFNPSSTVNTGITIFSAREFQPVKYLELVKSCVPS